MHDVSASTSTSSALDKEDRLIAWCRDRESLLVGFSGGVDSAYLACVALEALGPGRVLAVIGRSPSYPATQWETARRVAEQFAIPVVEIDTQELDDPRYAANPSNRCYFCKTELWSRLGPLARARGLAAIVDGTNADDLAGHRPGAAAGVENGVRSPLAELGFTKAEIRERSRIRSIPTWDQPSSPCLASRLPYGVAVTTDRLAQIERAESALRALGIEAELRVRHHGDLARVELGTEDLARWLEPSRARRLSATVRRHGGFARVAIDLRGYRSGSLNVLAGVTTT